MMKPAKNRMRNNVSEPLDRACAGRILPKRNMRSHLVIIDGIFRKDSSKVLRVERDRPLATSSCLQRRGDLHPTQADFDPIGRYDYLLDNVPDEAFHLDGRHGEPSLGKLECIAQGHIKRVSLKIERRERITDVGP
jgi:hypothetical protein